MIDAGITDVVLQVRGNLTQDGCAALAENFERIDAEAIVRLNEVCPPGAIVSRKHVERVMNVGACLTRSVALSKTGWVGEAVDHWRCWPDKNEHQVEKLDLSIIQNLFDACDPNSTKYDWEFHCALFREKPHFFGEDGLPRPVWK